MLRTLAIVFLLIFFPRPSVAQQTDSLLSVSGHVLYKDGSPVKGAEVKIFFYYRPANGIEDAPATTDDRGVFNLHTHTYGEGVVTASKESEGFANYVFLLYGRKVTDSVRPINLITNKNVNNLVLKFGDPNEIIRFQVEDYDTHESIKTARIEVRLLEHPQIVSSSTVSPDGSRLVVMPSEPVIVDATAPGYADWTFRDSSATHSLSLPGKVKDQQIRLKKIISPDSKRTQSK